MGHDRHRAQRVLASALAAGGDFTLALPHGAQWQPIRAFGDLPAVPVPVGTGGTWFGRSPQLDAELVNLSLLVMTDRMWIGLSRVMDYQEITDRSDGTHDWDRLGVLLREHKATAFFADRSDAELAAEGGVPYADLVSAAETLQRAGFRDVAFVEPGALSAAPAP